VSIEVHRGTTTAKRVELYVVDGLCTTDDAGNDPCPQLKTPSAASYLDGEVYTRKDGHAFAAAIESDGVAYFTIRSNGDKTRVPLAIAVGFDANDVRVGAVLLPFEVYTTDYMRVLVKLEPIVDDVVTGQPMSDGLRAETWYEDPTVPDRIGCLALEHTFGGTTDRKFIVPADDLDCDGFLADDECDSIWPHHGPDDNDLSRAFTCVDHESASGSTKRCLLGDAQCIDGEGPAACNEVQMNGTHWCVPSNLCDPLCKDSTNPGCLYTALKHPTMPAQTHASYVRCTVPVQMEATFHHVCRDAMELPFVTPSPVPVTTTCTSLSLGRVTSTQIGPFTTEIMSSTVPTNVIKTSLAPECVPLLQIAGDFPNTTNLMNAFPEHVVKLDLTNGLSLIIPLVLQFAPTDAVDCATAAGSCELVVAGITTNVDESLAACMRY
jgi:hypothetical protein